MLNIMNWLHLDLILPFFYLFSVCLICFFSSFVNSFLSFFVLIEYFCSAAIEFLY